MQERKTLGLNIFFIPGAACAAGTVLLAALLAGPVIPREAAATTKFAERGQGIFQQKCSSCHTIGGDKLVGPDLQDVTTRRKRDWLARFIAEPDKLLAEGDSIAVQLFEEYKIPMPNLGVSKEEVEALLAYLHAPRETEHHPAPPTEVEPSPAKPKVAGDPRIGRNLFIGTVYLQNKGAPCIACHDAGRVAALGGGALGPDLTPAFKNYGGTGLESVLKTLPFPTMEPIYGGRPLTADEQAHLKAFLREASAQTRPDGAVGFGLIASGLFLTFLLLPHLIWRKRLQEVRKRLIRKAYER